MDTYTLPVAACGPQSAIQVLHGWAAEGKLLALVFVDARRSLFVSSMADRVEVQENGALFLGPDNSIFGVVFPKAEDEGYLEYWGFDLADAPDGNVAFRTDEQLTRESALSELASKRVPCVEIGTASGCLLVYELLAVVTPLPTVQ